MTRRMHMSWLDSWTGHALSIGALLAVFAGVLPAMAAIASFLWFAIQIYESRTVQHWKNNRRMRNHAKKLARLRAKEKVTLAEIAALERIRHAGAEARDLVGEARAEAATLVAAEEFAAKASQLPPSVKPVSRL